MNLPSALFTVRWLTRDTFRQALSSGVFWLMLGVSVVCGIVRSFVWRSARMWAAGLSGLSEARAARAIPPHRGLH